MVLIALGGVPAPAEGIFVVRKSSVWSSSTIPRSQWCSCGKVRINAAPPPTLLSARNFRTSVSGPKVLGPVFGWVQSQVFVSGVLAHP